MRLPLGNQWADIPEMPDDFRWDQEDGDINLRQRNEGGARTTNGFEVMGYVSALGGNPSYYTYLSRLNAAGTTCVLRTGILQDAIDLLATRAMLGGADISELP